MLQSLILICIIALNIVLSSTLNLPISYAYIEDISSRNTVTVSQSVYDSFENNQLERLPVKIDKASEIGEHKEEVPLTKKAIEDDTKDILISFAGDCTLGTDETFSYINSFPYRLHKENNNYGYFFEKVRPIFNDDDLTLVNLETTLTKATKKANKTFRFKGDPSYVNILKEGSIEMVNISNNHIYDYLNQGFKDTLVNLKAGNILYSGEGHIGYFDVDNITIASLGYRGWNLGIKSSIVKDIEEARKKAQIVIVSFHWGQERKFYPNNTQLELGRFAIDKGADIVVGHHPHVIQGIEKYKEKYIVYSLGNFSFGGNRNPSDKDTFIFQCKFKIKDNKIRGLSKQITPCSISSVGGLNNFQPNPLKGKEGERVLNRLFEYSKKLKYGIKR